MNVALLDNFRANLESQCKELSISQSELSRRSGIHRVTITRILSGSIDPSVATCEKLAKAAGIRPDTIFLEPVEETS